jgi:hypothetical protein
MWRKGSDLIKLDQIASSCSREGTVNGGVKVAARLLDTALEAVDARTHDVQLSMTINIDLWHSEARDIIRSWKGNNVDCDSTGRIKLAVWVPDLL